MTYEFVGGKTLTRGEHSYITGVDGLRAIAVLSVVAFHIDRLILPGGFAGVDVFFVISGFVVSMTTSRIRAENLGFLLFAFYRRRIVRILPAALVFLLTVQLAATLFIPIVNRITVQDMTGVVAPLGASNIVLWLKAGDYFLPGAVLNPFTHTWSLAVEEQFYLLFPFFALLIWSGGRDRGGRLIGIAGVGLFALASLGLAALFTAKDPSFAFYMLPTRFWELATGVMLFLLVSRERSPSDATWLAPSLTLFGVAVLGGAFAFLSQDNFPFPGALPPVIASATLIYVVSIWPQSALSKILSSPPFRYFGRISYSLYLWHWGVIVLMLWTCGLETPLQKVVAVLVSIALADLSYRFVEQPMRLNPWLKGRSSKQIALGGGVAVATAIASIALLILFRPELTMSVTGNRDVWDGTLAGKSGQCAVTRGKAAFAGGNTRYSFDPHGCTGPVDSRHFYVVGDSHAWAYQRLVSNVAGRQALPSTIYTSFGCAVMPLHDKPSKPCRSFVSHAVARVTQEAKPNDVVLLPGLRIQKYRDYWEPDFQSARAELALDDAVLQHELDWVKPLLDRGVRIIFEAPKPVYKIAPLRCADWFNRSNPHCQVAPVTRSEALGRRAHAMQFFARLKELEPRIEIWDPFARLCPGEICDALLDGQPVTSDGNHLSGYANDLLSPDVIELLKAR